MKRPKPTLDIPRPRPRSERPRPDLDEPTEAVLRPSDLAWREQPEVDSVTDEVAAAVHDEPRDDAHGAPDDRPYVAISGYDGTLTPIETDLAPFDAGSARTEVIDEDLVEEYAPPPAEVALDEQADEGSVRVHDPARLSAGDWAGAAQGPPAARHPRPETPSLADPGSFSRMFIGSLKQYQTQAGRAGPATEAAAVALAGDEPVVAAAETTGRSLRSPVVILETVVLTAVVPLAGLLLHGEDPFFLRAGFSWLVFPPLLLGLRHGFAPAMVSAAILDSLLAVSWRTQLAPMDGLPGDTLVGLATVAMLTGQFSDVWKRELARLDGGFGVVRKQLGELMRSYFLLELSHDRLQERTGKGAPSLRDTMLAVQRAVEGRPHAKLADLADAMAELLQTYTMVEVAAIHAVVDGAVAGEPMAVIGRPAPLDPADHQLRTALRERRLTYIVTDAGEDREAKTRLIAVVPIVDAWKKLHGVVAIESMPLLAFERRNLEALAILGGHFADVIATGGKDVQRGQRKEFEIRLRRALRDLVDHDVPSTIFAMIIHQGAAVSDSIETLLGGTLRALDFPFVHRDAAGDYCVYILLPATGQAGARALGARMERIVRDELNMKLTRAGAFHFFHELRTDDSVERVMGLLEGKALDGFEHTYVG